MRLHLPKKLLAAVIAACFTLPVCALDDDPLATITEPGTATRITRASGNTFSIIFSLDPSKLTSSGFAEFATWTIADASGGSAEEKASASSAGVKAGYSTGYLSSIEPTGLDWSQYSTAYLTWSQNTKNSTVRGKPALTLVDSNGNVSIYGGAAPSGLYWTTADYNLYSVTLKDTTTGVKGAVVYNSLTDDSASLSYAVSKHVATSRSYGLHNTSVTMTRDMLDTASTVTLDKSTLTLDAGVTAEISRSDSVVIAGNAESNVVLQKDYSTAWRDATYRHTDKLSFGNGWNGTVTLQGGALNNTNLDSYSNGSNSTVELKGVQGYQEGAKTILSNLKLTNVTSGNTTYAGLTFTDGSSDTTLTFSGTISGEGDLKRDTGNGSLQTYKFTGDYSNWSGNFVNNSGSKVTELEFSGSSTPTVAVGVTNSGGTVGLNYKYDNATEISGDISKGEGTLNLTAWQGGTKTFSGNVNINKYMAMEGAGESKFTGTLSATQLVLNSSTLTLDNGGTYSSGTIETTGGTLQFNSGAYIELSNMTIGKRIEGGDTDYVGIVQYYTDRQAFTSASTSTITVDAGVVYKLNGEVVQGYSYDSVNKRFSSGVNAYQIGNNHTMTYADVIAGKGDTAISHIIISDNGIMSAFSDTVSLTDGISIVGTGTVQINGNLLNGQGHFVPLDDEFAGTIEIMDGGIVNMAGANHLSHATAFKINTGGSLSGNTQTRAQALYLAGGTINASGGTWSGNITISSASVIAAAAGTSTAFSGTITNESSLVLTKQGEGTIKTQSSAAVAAKLHISDGIVELTDRMGSSNDLSAISSSQQGVLSLSGYDGVAASMVSLGNDFKGTIMVSKAGASGGNAGYLNAASTFGNASKIALNFGAIIAKENATHTISQGIDIYKSWIISETGASLTFNGEVNEIGTETAVSISGDGEKIFNGNVNLGTKEITNIDGALTFSGSTTKLKNLKISSGSVILSDTNATVNASLDMSNNKGATGNLTIQDGAALNVAGTFYLRSHNEANTGSIISVDSESSLSLGGIKISGNNLDTEASIYATDTGTTYTGARDTLVKGATMSVSNAIVTLESGSNTTVEAKLTNSSLVNQLSGSTLTEQRNVEGDKNLIFEKIDASLGNINLLHKGEAEVDITDLCLSGGNTVGVYQGDTSSDVATVNVQNLHLSTGGSTTSTLEANLVLVQGGSITIDAGTELNLGCTLTLNSGITLGGTLFDNWDKTQALTLFTGVDGLTINGAQAGEGTLHAASDVFSNEGMSNYSLKMTGGVGGQDYVVQLVANNPSPEPTTATLSLLALIGLAAIRRRKA